MVEKELSRKLNAVYFIIAAYPNAMNTVIVEKCLKETLAITRAQALQSAPETTGAYKVIEVRFDSIREVEFSKP